MGGDAYARKLISINNHQDLWKKWLKKKKKKTFYKDEVQLTVENNTSCARWSISASISFKDCYRTI